MGVAGIFASGFPILVMMIKNPSRYIRKGETVDLFKLAQEAEGEATVTFDRVPDHYARGLSVYAWPLRTIPGELSKMSRFRERMRRMVAAEPWLCTTRKGILILDYNTKKAYACLLMPYNRREQIAKKMAVIVPGVHGDMLVFTEWPVAVEYLKLHDCVRVATGVYYCRGMTPEELEKALEKRGVLVFKARSSEPLDVYAERLGFRLPEVAKA